jgi:hypothetical protein
MAGKMRFWVLSKGRSFFGLPVVRGNRNRGVLDPGDRGGLDGFDKGSLLVMMRGRAGAGTRRIEEVTRWGISPCSIFPDSRLL